MRTSTFLRFAATLAASAGVVAVASPARAQSDLRSPLGASYDSFDSERYILTMENRTLRDVASFAP